MFLNLSIIPQNIADSWIISGQLYGSITSQQKTVRRIAEWHGKNNAMIRRDAIYRVSYRNEMRNETR